MGHHGDGIGCIRSSVLRCTRSSGFVGGVEDVDFAGVYFAVNASDEHVGWGHVVGPLQRWDEVVFIVLVDDWVPLVVEGPGHPVDDVRGVVQPMLNEFLEGDGFDDNGFLAVERHGWLLWMGVGD